jgi:hypothetical protein
MDKLAERILNVFGEFNLDVDQYLPTGSLLSKTSNWNDVSIDQINIEIDYLINNSFIKYSEQPSGYVLLQSGFDYIYPEVTLEEVISKVLQIFIHFGIKKGQVLPYGSFYSSYSKWEIYYLKKIDEALDEMINQGIIVYNHSPKSLLLNKTV